MSNYSKARWAKAVTKLVEGTRRNEIKWSAKDPPRHLINDDDIDVGAAYSTKYKGRRLQIVQYREKNYPTRGPDSIDLMARNAFGGDPLSQQVRENMAKPKWEEKTHLAIVDGNRREIFEVPEVTGIDSLISAVQKQAAGVDSFLDDILSE